MEVREMIKAREDLLEKIRKLQIELLELNDEQTNYCENPELLKGMGINQLESILADISFMQGDLRGFSRTVRRILRKKR
jgi:hypothetical protein